MATSLISNIQKTQVRAILDDIHETFAREIVVFEDGERVLISASPEYNAIYGRTRVGSNTNRNPISHIIKARIKYINANQELFSDKSVSFQTDIELISGSVRITVDQDGFEILKEAKRAEFEGRRYKIASKGNAVGMFGPQYYQFFLQPLDE
jgi:hypothetical protein